MTTSPTRAARVLAALCALLLGLVLTAAVVVGVYAIRDPNHIDFGGPWPLASEPVALATAAFLAFGARAQRRRRRVGLFAFNLAAALLALVLLGWVALVLSFNQL